MWVSLVLAMVLVGVNSPAPLLAAASSSVDGGFTESEASTSPCTSATAGVAEIELATGFGTIVLCRKLATLDCAVAPLGLSSDCITALMPVATTDTRITPSSLSSKADPKIMVASASTSLRIRLAASSTSNNVISMPPVILIRTAWAPFIVVSSRSGLLMAASAA